MVDEVLQRLIKRLSGRDQGNSQADNEAKSYMGEPIQQARRVKSHGNSLLPVQSSSKLVSPPGYFANPLALEVSLKA